MCDIEIKIYQIEICRVKHLSNYKSTRTSNPYERVSCDIIRGHQKSPGPKVRVSLDIPRIYKG